ncbi:MAG: hypothetical protein RPU52_01495 [Candidatus Sedimenticola sp. (ex Thyasira tokunagai)]
MSLKYVGSAKHKPKVIIINCFSDKHRGTRGSPHFAPQSMAPVYLAGAFHPQKTDLYLYSEFFSGPFEDLKKLQWADLLVLTGVNTAFDRMRQVTAYARTVNPSIRVVIGGPVARVLPNLCAQYFDVVCTGDVEQMAEVAEELLGPGFAAEDIFPRYDLVNWMPLIGYAETTRNCNFRCSFCSMTAEDRPFENYDLSFMRRQVEAMGYKQCVMFLDQNLFGGPRDHFKARMELIQELYDEKRFRGWSALVTTDFFKSDENIQAAANSGCIGFFSGVESFSPEQIIAFNKRQNLILPQELVIRRCLEAGMVFHYGLVFDPVERSIAAFRDELDLIVSNPRITLPSFLTLAIPLIGTPLFRERMGAGAFLPNLRLRDMDGRTLIYKTKDPLGEAIRYVEKMETGPIDKKRLLAYAAKFFWRYKGTLSRWAMISGLLNVVSTGMPSLGTNAREKKVPHKLRERTFCANTESLGSLYEPIIQIPERYQGHFQPLLVTDEKGELHPDLWDDLGESKAVAV